VVKKLSLALVALVALVMVACGGGGASTPSSRPAATSAPTRPTSGPSASVEPKTGPPGTQVEVSGSGWPAKASVVITGDASPGQTAKPYAAVTVRDDGSFLGAFLLEKKADGTELGVGRYDLVIQSGSTEVRVPFQVQTRRPVAPTPSGG
jgi:hypothetical protein